MNLIPALDRFLEASRQAARRRALIPHERRLEKAVARAFRRQGRLFLQAVGRLRAPWPLTEAVREASVDDWLAAWEEIAGLTRADFIGPVETAAGAALLAGARQTAAEIEFDIAFNLKNPRAVAYLEQVGADLVTNVNATTRDEIRRMVVEGARDRLSYDQVAQNITARFKQFAVGQPQLHIASRAHLVAVTEAGNAYTEGNLVMGRQLAAAGLVMEKRWLSVGDDRVSQGCRTNQAAGWIELEAAFPSGHQRPLRFPSCRCDLQMRRAKP